MKAVIPAAGTGTRLLPTTKEQPKELLPVFSRSSDGKPLVKPILQLIFEQLYECGVREFYFIGGRKKRTIEDHFSVDYSFIDSLNREGRSFYADELSKFYDKIASSQISWINQPLPRGFGHAVLMAKPFVGDEPFLVHAGDTLILSKMSYAVNDLIEAHELFESLATFLVCHVKDPSKYGVITGKERQERILDVESMIEKPSGPKSNLAIMPVYIFDRSIFGALEKTSPGKNNEIQLTDAIAGLLEITKKKVIAVKMNHSDSFIDVGNPESYWEALNFTYHNVYSVQEERSSSLPYSRTN